MLAVVIVNYNSDRLLVDCLTSVDRERSLLPSKFHVWVVDNDSDDGSMGRVDRFVRSQSWSDWVRLVSLHENRGFAGGNNAAIRLILDDAETQWVLLLNPDTQVRPGGIRALIDFMKEHQDVGIAGSRLEYPDGTSQCAARRFPSIAGEFDSGLRLGLVTRLLRSRIGVPEDLGEPFETDWVPGASMMIRREVFEDIGLLDEGYFLYFEEVDFCRRAKAVGWPCWYVPASRVVHLVGQSTGVTRTTGNLSRRPPYWFDSRTRYFRKSHGRFGKFVADLAWAFGFACYRVRQKLFRRRDADPPHLLKDFIHHNLCPLKRSN